MDILEACVETETAMVCLLPNSMDKLQPLDVRWCVPLYEELLERVSREFKLKFPKKSGVDKCEFPPLLKKTLLKADLGPMPLLLAVSCLSFWKKLPPESHTVTCSWTMRP